MQDKDTQNTAERTSEDIIKILFVCTGNTCRSPMAQAVFNREAKKAGLSARAFSRGLFADGSPLSENSRTVLSECGFEIGDHISATVSEKDISEAALVIGITSRHATSLIDAFPKYKDKIRAFPMDISDPFGGNTEVYRSSLSDICNGMDKILSAISEMLEDNGNTLHTKADSDGEIVIERLSASHIDGIEKVENECFSEPWSINALRELLGCNYAVYFVARDTEGSNVAGYCGMYVSLDTGAINNIGVLPEYRRKGIGARLLSEIINYSKNNGISLLTLEVREGDGAARALYEKFGFQEAGVRKNYYKKPIENAVLYNKQIT